MWLLRGRDSLTYPHTCIGHSTRRVTLYRCFPYPCALVNCSDRASWHVLGFQDALGDRAPPKTPSASSQDEGVLGTVVCGARPCKFSAWRLPVTGRPWQAQALAVLSLQSCLLSVQKSENESAPAPAGSASRESGVHDGLWVTARVRAGASAVIPVSPSRVAGKGAAARVRSGSSVHLPLTSL